MAATVDTRPVSAVVAAIVDNLQDIVRSEAHLAKAELKEEASEAARPAIQMALGFAFAFYALGLFIVALVLLLSRVLQFWASSGLAGMLLSIAALTLFTTGRRRWKLVPLLTEKALPAPREKT